MSTPTFWLALGCTAPADDRPDVVLITIDTLRADHLGFAGWAGAHTPRIDELAAQSMVFERATTPFPRTTPALASLLTGLRPAHHGSHEVGQPMTAEHTLATALRDVGYETHAVSATGAASPEQSLDRGFASFSVHPDARGAEISRIALDTLRAAKGAPALLWVHYADPHFPYQPPDDGALKPEAPRCRALVERVEKRTLERVLLFTDRGGISSEAKDECIALYDAEIAATDAAVGSLLEGISSIRGARPRLIVLTSDHGENLGEGGLFFEHGPSLDDAVLHIPLLMSGPSIRTGQDTGIARLEDLAPTLLDLLGQPPLPQSDGRSLAPTLAGTDAPDRPRIALVESGSALHVPMFRYLVSGKGERWCLNDSIWSWCRLGAKRGLHLYNHDIDPELSSPRDQEEPEQVTRFTEAALRWKPEQAHRYAVLTPTASLLAHPRIEGGHDLSLYDITSGQPIDDPELSRSLAEALREMTLDRPPAERSPQDEELLRSLGYIE